MVNPLAWDRDDAVHFRLPGASVSVAVTDAAGKAVPAQTSVLNGTTHVTFRAVGVPALGSAAYILSAAGGDDGSAATVVVGPAAATVAPVLENDAMKLEFDTTGRLTNVNNKARGLSMTASLGVRFYTPTDLKDKKPKKRDG